MIVERLTEPLARRAASALCKVLALSVFLTLALVSVALADQVTNRIDTTPDATLENITLNEGATQSVAFGVVSQNGDGDQGCNIDLTEQLVIALSSSDTSVATLSPQTLTYISCGLDQSATVTAGARGTATISAAQAAGASSNTTGSGTFDYTPASFTVTVNNVAPTISAIANQTTNEDTSTGAIAFTVGDAGTPAANLTLSGSSSNTTLVPNSNISFGGSGANRTLTVTPAADQSGTSTITVSVSDGAATTNRTFVLTVNAVNDAPVNTVPGAQSVNEDTPLTFSSANSNLVSISDVDAGSNPVKVSLGVTSGKLTLGSTGGLTFTSGSNGTSNMTFTGSLANINGALSGMRYVPTADYNGSLQLTITTDDQGNTGSGGAKSATNTVNITVTAVNDTPSFQKGANQTVDEDAGAQTVTGWATNVSKGPANESGQTVEFLVSNDNNSLFTSSGQPAVTSNGTLIYTPAADANGSATVTVRARDDGGTANGGQDTSAPQTFTITVRPVNDAPSFTKGANQTVNEDSGAQSVAGWATNISAGPNESGQTVSFLVSNDSNALFTAGGQPAVSSNGTLTYTPAADANGSATVTVRARDDGGTANGGVDTSAAHTFTITVNPVNDTPAANGDTRTMNEDGDPITIDFGALVSDVETSNANLTYDITAPDPAKGSLGGTGSTRTFTPAADFNGTVNISYTVTDRGDPDNCGAAGSDCDAPKTSASKTVTINVTAVNDAPVARDGSATTDEDASKLISLSANDVDGDSLSYKVISLPVHGKLYRGDSTDAADEITAANLPFTLSGGNQVTYKPDADYGGSDSFKFRANDGTIDSSIATVNITVTAVNDAPVNTVPGAQSTNEDNALIFSGANGNQVSISDVDAGGNPVQVRLEATNGKLSLSGTNGLTFTAGSNGTSDMTFTGTIANINSALGGMRFDPNQDYNGSAQLKITTNDQGNAGSGGARSDIATVNITVNAVNDDPTISHIADQTVDEDEATSDIAFTVGDVETLAGNLQVTGSSSDTTLVPNANITFGGSGADRTVKVTPAANQSGEATITVTVSDGSQSTSDTFKVTVRPVNDAPSFTKGANQTVNEDSGAQTVNGWATNISTGPANESTQTLSFVITENSDPDLFSAGPAVAPDGALSYTPAADAHGTATIKVKITDSGGTANGGVDESAEKTFTVTVNPVNDAPGFTKGADQTVDEDAGTQSVDDWATDISAGPANEAGQTVSFVVTNDNNSLFSAQPTIDSGGKLTYTPAADANGSASVTVRARDDSGTANGGSDTSAAQTFTITVEAVNDAPSANDDEKSVEEDGTLSFSASDLTANDSPGPNEGSQSLSVTGVGDATNGTVSLSNGEITFTPDRNHNGPASFSYTVCDSGTPQECATARVGVDVTAVNDQPEAQDDAYSVTEDDTLSVAAPGVLRNDTDVDGNQLTPEVVSGPRNGELTLNADGSFDYRPAANYSGTDSFTYRISDGDGGSATATVEIDVTAVNDPPTAVDDQAMIDEDTSAVIEVRSNDSPGPGEGDQTLTVTGVTNPPNGEAEVISSGPNAGKVRYTPDADFNGLDTFSYTVCDSGDPQQCTTAVVTVTVGSVNDRPVARDDTADTVEDTGVTVDLLANDTDADGALDPASVRITSEPANGAAAVNPDGTVTYTPDADFNGSDAFAYTVCDDADPRECSEPATVTVGVEAVNDAPRAADDEKGVEEDGTLTFPASDLTANDSPGPDDESDQTLSVTKVENASGGSVSLEEGQVTFRPSADYNGEAGFTYTVCDDGEPGKCATATVNVDVTPVNDPPVARDGERATDEDQQLNIPAPGVLFNDTDADGDRLAAVVEQGPRHGRATLEEDGSFTYTPDEDFNGEDSFTYTVSDGNGASDVGKVRITVRPINDEPVATDDELTTDEDSPAELNVLSNDDDVDGDPLTLTGFTQPQNGTVDCAPDGTCTYTPARDFNGEDSFTYRVSDGNGGNVTARVNVTVNGVNDAPQALADAYDTEEDEPLTVDAPGVLDNDTDAEGDQLTAEVVGGPQHGSLDFDPDGSFTYTPDENFNGTDTFEYRISDGNGGTDTATVRIGVGAANDAPVGRDDTAAVDEDSPVDIDVLENDGDPEGDTLRITNFTQPRFGTVVCTPQGVCTYTPRKDFNGTDSFTYTVSDGVGGEAGATVTVTVRAVNDPPVAEGGDFVTNEDERLTVEAPGVLGNDRDPDGDGLTASVERGPQHGELELSADGSFTYMPDENFKGEDSLAYTASDGDGGTDSATVRISVRPVNDVPKPVDDTASTEEDSAKVLDVLANDEDVDGDPLTLTGSTRPEHGVVDCEDSGVCTYTPDADFNGEDSFTYDVGDGRGGTASATVSITVTGVNDAPRAADDEKGVEEDGTLTFPASDLTANDSPGPDDESDQTLSVTKVENASGGSVSLEEGQVTFRPSADYNGEAGFTYTVCDDGEPGKCATATVNVNVTAVNDAPENTVPGAQSTDDAAALVFSGENRISVSDDGGEARVTLFVSDGTLSLGGTEGLTFDEGDGTNDGKMTFTGSIASINAALAGLRYRPGGYHGKATLTVSTSDLGNTGAGGPKSDEDTVEITIRDTTAPDAPGVDLASASDTGRSDTDNITSETRPTLGGRAEPNSTVRLYDGETLLAEVAADVNGDWTYTMPEALSEGEHRISATATDEAGNVSGRSEPLVITVDTTAPDTFIDASPPSPTNHRDTVRFFSSSEQGATFECSFDGSAFEPCDSPKDYDNLSDGEHTFRVRAVDEAGNADQSPASRTFVVDTRAPEVSLTAPEDGALVRGEITLSADVSDEHSVRNVLFLIDGEVFDSDMSEPYALTWDSNLVPHGEHTITVRAYDEAGNVAESQARTIRVDNTAPDTVINGSPAALTNQTRATFEFGSPDDEGATFECSLDDSPFEACESGRYYEGLSDGEHVFKVRALDAAGNRDASPAERTFTVDTRTPDAPRITSPSSGSRQDNSFTISGTAEPNSTVRLYEGETLVATVTADENGDWSADLADVSDGDHTYTARATNGAGNTSADSEPLALNIDTAAPDTVITSSPSNPTRSASATFGFRSTEENSTFECKLDGAAYEPCEPGEEYTGLSEGEHVFLVRAVDAAGNADQSPASRTFVVDTRAPDAPEISAPAEGITDNDGDFTVTGTAEPGSRVELLENGEVVGTATADESGDWSVDLTGVADGSHTYTARATDEAGNTSAPSAGRTINVDSGALEVERVIPQEDAPDVPVNIHVQAVFSEPIDESTLGGDSFTLVKEGSNERVSASVDYDPATGAITLIPDSDLDFESVYTATIKGSADGVKDRAGNPLAQDRVWRFTTARAPDTRAPDAPGVDLAADSDTGRSDTDNRTSDTTPTITGSAEPGSRVELFLDGNPIGATSADESGNYSFTLSEPLSERKYRITATATDAAGNTSPASEALEITVDTTPADTVITRSPDALTNQTRATFEFSSPGEENATFECSLDDGPFEPCASPKDYEGLSDGEHVFRVRSVDAAGNRDASPAERRLTVDTRAPSAPEITSPDDGARRGSSFTVSGTAEPNSTVRLYEGETLVATVTAGETGGWSVPFTGVPDGAHTYTARVTNGAGNTSAASAGRTVNVDTGAPDAIITKSPPSLTNQTRVSFEFDSPDEDSVGFECSLDDGPFESCESGRYYENLSDGEHVFRVRALDAAGNASENPAQRTFNVDTEAPTARITSPQDGALVRDEVVIGAEASDNVGLRRTEFVIDILINGQVIDSDLSVPYTTTWDSNLVPDGEHTVTVRAYDEAGNVGTSETRTIRVDNTAPDTIVRTSPDDLTNDRTATFQFNSPGEENVSFECSLDGAAYEPCESGRQYQGLSDGEHVFRVRAVDTAGNADPSPAERRFVIDTGAPGSPRILSPADGQPDRDGNFTVSGTAEPNSTVRLYDGEELVGTTTADGAGNWSVDLREVVDGSHPYTATATDETGNVSGRSETLTVVVDRTVDTGITEGPSGIVDSGTVRFYFAATDAGALFECSLDGGSFAACESGKVYENLSEGPHTFQVRAISSAGNRDETPAGRTFTVDLPDPLVVRDDRGSTGEAAAVRNSFISQYASSSAPTRLLRLNTSKRPYTLDPAGGNIASPTNAIGYRSTDRSLYGYRMTGSLGIVQIDPQTGATNFLGSPTGLPVKKNYFAGDVSPDGSTYYLYANKSGVLWAVNLTTFAASSVKLSSAISVADFAVSPTDSNLYGVDAKGRLLRVDPRTGRVTTIKLVGARPGIYGATWFTADGDLIAYQNGSSKVGGFMTWIEKPTTTAPRVKSSQPGPYTLGNDGAAYVAPPDPAGLSVVVDVLANDGDPAGALNRNTLQIEIVQQPANGTVAINADKTITYTSGSSYRGTDSFRYRVCENGATRRCGIATVNITSAP